MQVFDIEPVKDRGRWRGGSKLAVAPLAHGRDVLKTFLPLNVVGCDKGHIARMATLREYF